MQAWILLVQLLLIPMSIGTSVQCPPSKCKAILGNNLYVHTHTRTCIHSLTGMQLHKLLSEHKVGLSGTVVTLYKPIYPHTHTHAHTHAHAASLA